MNKFLIFILAMILPDQAFGHGGEMVWTNIFVIFGTHMVGLFILLMFLDYKIILFHIAVTAVSFLAYGYVTYIFFWDSPINILFFVSVYLALLVLPFFATYLFYRKTRNKNMPKHGK